MKLSEEAIDFKAKKDNNSLSDGAGPRARFRPEAPSNHREEA
jgi:hypothetical protein